MASGLTRWTTDHIAELSRLEHQLQSLAEQAFVHVKGAPAPVASSYRAVPESIRDAVRTALGSGSFPALPGGGVGGSAGSASLQAHQHHARGSSGNDTEDTPLAKRRKVPQPCGQRPCPGPGDAGPGQALSAMSLDCLLQLASGLGVPFMAGADASAPSGTCTPAAGGSPLPSVATPPSAKADATKQRRLPGLHASPISRVCSASSGGDGRAVSGQLIRGPANGDAPAVTQPLPSQPSVAPPDAASVESQSQDHREYEPEQAPALPKKLKRAPLWLQQMLPTRGRPKVPAPNEKRQAQAAKQAAKEQTATKAAPEQQPQPSQDRAPGLSEAVEAVEPAQAQAAAQHDLPAAPSSTPQQIGAGGPGCKAAAAGGATDQLAGAVPSQGGAEAPAERAKSPISVVVAATAALEAPPTVAPSPSPAQSREPAVASASTPAPAGLPALPSSTLRSQLSDGMSDGADSGLSSLRQHPVPSLTKSQLRRKRQQLQEAARSSDLHEQLPRTAATSSDCKPPPPSQQEEVAPGDAGPSDVSQKPLLPAAPVLPVQAAAEAPQLDRAAGQADCAAAGTEEDDLTDMPLSMRRGKKQKTALRAPTPVTAIAAAAEVVMKAAAKMAEAAKKAQAAAPGPEVRMGSVIRRTAAGAARSSSATVAEDAATGARATATVPALAAGSSATAAAPGAPPGTAPSAAVGITSVADGLTSKPSIGVALGDPSCMGPPVALPPSNRQPPFMLPSALAASDLARASPALASGRGPGASTQHLSADQKLRSLFSARTRVRAAASDVLHISDEENEAGEDDGGLEAEVARMAAQLEEARPAGAGRGATGLSAAESAQNGPAAAAGVPAQPTMGAAGAGCMAEDAVAEAPGQEDGVPCFQRASLVTQDSSVAATVVVPAAVAAPVPQGLTSPFRANMGGATPTHAPPTASGRVNTAVFADGAAEAGAVPTCSAAVAAAAATHEQYGPACGSDFAEWAPLHQPPSDTATSPSRPPFPGAGASASQQGQPQEPDQGAALQHGGRQERAWDAGSSQGAGAAGALGSSGAMSGASLRGEEAAPGLGAAGASPPIVVADQVPASAVAAAAGTVKGPIPALASKDRLAPVQPPAAAPVQPMGMAAAPSPTASASDGAPTAHLVRPQTAATSTDAPARSGKPPRPPPVGDAVPMDPIAAPSRSVEAAAVPAKGAKAERKFKPSAPSRVRVRPAYAAGGSSALADEDLLRTHAELAAAAEWMAAQLGDGDGGHGGANCSGQVAPDGNAFVTAGAGSSGGVVPKASLAKVACGSGMAAGGIGGARTSSAAAAGGSGFAEWAPVRPPPSDTATSPVRPPQPAAQEGAPEAAMARRVPAAANAAAGEAGGLSVGNNRGNNEVGGGGSEAGGGVESGADAPFDNGRQGNDVVRGSSPGLEGEEMGMSAVEREEWRQRRAEIERQRAEAAAERDAARRARAAAAAPQQGGAAAIMSAAAAVSNAELNRRIRERLAEHHQLAEAAAAEAEAKEEMRTKIREQLHEKHRKALEEHSLVQLLRQLGVLAKSAVVRGAEQRGKALKTAKIRFHPDKAGTSLEARVYAEEVSKLLNSCKWI